MRLEELLFFNPAQRTMTQAIMRSIERFGCPRIVECNDGLSIQLGGRDAQTLFALDVDQTVATPLAVAVYTRTSAEQISIAHVAVHPNYCQRSRMAGLGLGVRLIGQIKQIATRISGIRRIEFSYRERCVAVPR